MGRYDLQKMISEYFLNYLPNHSGISLNSIQSYRDAFVLFFQFYKEYTGKLPSTLTMAFMNRKHVLDFLMWLESERNYAVSSRNQRLAAIHAFIRYVQMECPEYIHQCSEIMSIKTKKVKQAEMSYLSVEAIRYLFTMPDRTIASGRRDLALLTLLYDSGARVQEVADTQVGDVRHTKPFTVTLTGKGRKTRVIPLMEQTVAIIERYKKDYKLNDTIHPLFFSTRKKKLTRAGNTYILKKYVTEAKRVKPELYPEKVSPHTIRRSKGMHLLEHNVNLVYIRDFLGHVSVVTTEKYAKANPEVKRKAIEVASTKILPEEIYTEDEKQDMINWLRSIL